MFFVQHVMRNAGSCRSLGVYSTALRQECALLDHPWLSPGEQLRVDRLVKALQSEDFHPLRRKHPLQEHHLQRFTALVDRRDPHQLLTLLLLYVGHDGLLRAGEITSGLMTTDVLWAPDRSALSLRFTRSKTCLTGPGFLVQFRDRPTPNAVSLMREWWDLMGLHHSRTVCLFPKRLSAARFDWSQSISYDSLASRVKSAAQSIGLPADDYSGHSLRAGGATDLFIARVPYYIIQRMGRWASDAALVYYRHEEDVLNAVSTAFQFVANPTSGGTPSYREGGLVV